MSRSYKTRKKKKKHKSSIVQRRSIGGENQPDDRHNKSKGGQFTFRKLQLKLNG